MTNEAWKATRCEVTIRDDGRVLDPGGCAIGSVQPTQPVGFWMGRDDRHRIISYHDTAHEAAIAVHDRARCSTRRAAELAWQVAPLCRQLGAMIDRSTSPEDREEVLAELRQIDQECARLRAEMERA